MFRFTIRDVLWLMVVVGCASILASRSAMAQPSMGPWAKELKAKSNKELINSLNTGDYRFQIALHNELVSRGKDVMPDVLASITTQEKNINDFAGFFGAMGAKAEAASPLLVSHSNDKRYAYTAVMMLDHLKPGTLASLPESTKQQAADALYAATIETDVVMIASHIAVLATLGKPAAPTFLRLLLTSAKRTNHLIASMRSDGHETKRQRGRARSSTPPGRGSLTGWQE